MIARIKSSTCTDWYDEICETLETLKAQAYAMADEGECLPTPELFELVKQQMQDLRRLIDYPTLPGPDVWLGEDGEIGLTWISADRQLDLIFTVTKLIAKLRVKTEKRLIEPSVLPVELKNFAA